MRSKIKEVIKIVLGSLILGFVCTIFVGGSLLGLCKGEVSLGVDIVLMASLIGFTLLFLIPSLIYTANKSLWNSISTSESQILKLLPNLRVFYEVVMFMATP